MELPVKEDQGIPLDEGGKHLVVGAPQQLGSILKEVADADGGDEHRQGGGLPEGLIGQPLNHNAQGGTHGHGQNDAQQRGQLVGRDGKKTDVRTHHDNIAVGEVEHFGNAVNHGVAQSNDGVHTAQTDTVNQVGQEGHHNTHL